MATKELKSLNLKHVEVYQKKRILSKYKNKLKQINYETKKQHWIGVFRYYVDDEVS